MSLNLQPDPLPLKVNADGVVLVGGTRVTLDTVVEAFESGASPEEIVCQYPSLHLGDVYSVVSFYLRRRSEIDAYLVDRRRKRDDTRLQNEAHHSSQGIRDRLLKRRHGSFGDSI